MLQALTPNPMPQTMTLAGTLLERLLLWEAWDLVEQGRLHGRVCSRVAESRQSLLFIEGCILLQALGQARSLAGKGGFFACETC